MTLSDRNEARRFISLIDCLYERTRLLHAVSLCEPTNLFSGDPEVFAAAERRRREAEADARNRPYVHVAHTLSTVHGGSKGEREREGESEGEREGERESGASADPNASYDEASLFTGEEEVFAFARACSRLREMRTVGYARRARERWREEQEGK